MESIGSMIVIMQMGIYIIMAVMIAIVGLYIYLMSPRKKSNRDFNGNTFDEMKYSDENMYDYSEESQYDSINSVSEENDDDPIKNL